MKTLQQAPSTPLVDTSGITPDGRSPLDQVIGSSPVRTRAFDNKA